MSDPRKKKMNEEVMAVYSREGINPMGSCLPMVVQMPIWWALYRMLNGAIELRHAPWIGWIHDLSAMDPYYILPIGMAIMMYLMTKMTPQTDHGSGAAENDGADAADDGIHFLPAFERIESVLCSRATWWESGSNII